jgi:transposase
MDRAYRFALARSPRDVRMLELGLPAFSTMGAKRRAGSGFQEPVRRSGLRVRNHRRHDRPGPPAWHRRKGGTQNQAIGRSRGGLTTKIVALVDALGNLTRFILLPGQRHDSIGVEPLIKDIDFGALLADKAFDNDALRTELNKRGALAVIPPKADRARRIPCDFDIYRWRHLVENFFCCLKAFRRIATRYDKTDSSFTAMIHLVGSALVLR